MTRLKFFPKRKRSFDQQSKPDNIISNTSPLLHSSLSHCSTVNPNSNYYSLNTAPVKGGNEIPVKEYSETNYFHSAICLDQVVLTFHCSCLDCSFKTQNFKLKNSAISNSQLILLFQSLSFLQN